MKENEKLRLGSSAQRLLLYTLPFMILLALALTLFVAQADAVTLLQRRESILLFLETISRLALCLALGTVLTDYAEKRTAGNS